MRAQWLRGWGAFFLGLLISGVACAEEKKPAPAVPGTINYVEGQVSLDGQALTSQAVGSTVLDSGRTLETKEGKAEVLLTPGVFLRVGKNSSVRMISPGLADTELELQLGQAIVEVAEIHPQNRIRIKEQSLTFRIEKSGLYDFDAEGNQLRVFEGRAQLETGSKTLTVKSAQEVITTDSGAWKVQKFDRKLYEDSDLYNWSSLRSAYVAEANVNEASYYEQYGGIPGAPGWWGSAWYWDPWFDAYTFMPWDGIFFSPFGWGFYSPWCVWRSPLYGYGYGFGYGGPVLYHRFSTNVQAWGPGTHYVSGPTYAKGIYRGPGSTGRGFHSGARLVASSRGFGAGTAHGHAGGFHGGAFHGGGGFHAGGGLGGHGH